MCHQVLYSNLSFVYRCYYYIVFRFLLSLFRYKHTEKDDLLSNLVHILFQIDNYFSLTLIYIEVF
jgi:hypothetical protein